jgi:cation:H+ antiporter
MSYVLLVIGLGLLFVGGDFLVKGAVGFALRIGISMLVVGLTVVSMATSAPELLVSLQAAIDNHPDMALGNVIGSNIANIGLIMGLTALFFSMPAERTQYRFDWLFMLTLSLCLLGSLYFFRGIPMGVGIFFTAVLIYYNYYKIQTSRRSNKALEELDVDAEAAKTPLWKTLGFLLIGIAGLRYGAKFFVEGASGIALDFGMSERAISVTVVAFGTSVPELAASLIAAFRKQQEIAIGNLIGSNIFNIMAVLGITATISPIKMIDSQLLRFDIWWMLGFSLLLVPIMGLVTKNKIGRGEGFLLTAGYVAYTILTLNR